MTPEELAAARKVLAYAALKVIVQIENDKIAQSCNLRIEIFPILAKWNR